MHVNDIRSVVIQQLDDGRGEAGPLEYGHADEGNDTSGKYAHPFASRGPGSDGPSWCPKGKTTQLVDDASRNRRAAQPELRGSAGIRHRGAGEASRD